MSASIRPNPRRISTPGSRTPAKAAPAPPVTPTRPARPARPAPVPLPVRPTPPAAAPRPAAARPPDPLPLPTRSYVSPWALPAAAPVKAPPPARGGRRDSRGGGKAKPGWAPLPQLTARQAKQVRRWSAYVALAIAGVVVLGGLGIAGRALWEMRTPPLVSRHRPEALCFQLAAPPQFAPPMVVEPSVAVLRGRFSPRTPAGYAIREAMGLTDPLVIGEKRRTVGDFEVTTLWARIPGQDGFWLVIGWMEGADLASLSFHFPSADGALSRETVNWGDKLVARVLKPANFVAATPPIEHWRPTGKATMPSFGPPPAR